MNWYLNYYTLCIYFLIFTSQFTQVPFIGNMKLGFSFGLLPVIKVDYLNQQIFVCSKESIIQNNNQLSFSISVCDIKNNSLSSYRFIPIVTKNAIVNGILEANPLYETGFANFNLLLGLDFEPKFYPIVNPINSSQIYIINNLELYNNQQNKLIATEPLLDINSNEGTILSISPLQNQFIAAVMEKNTVFGGNNSFCQFYQYQVKEKVIQIPGSSNYITMLQLSNPNIFSFTNQNPSLCTINENQVNLLENYLTTHGNQTLNKAYIGVSGNGPTGIKAVTLYDQPILLSSSESALNGNNIVATNIPNANLYINKLASLFTSTGLCYLTILGGTNTMNTSLSTVYAIPLINSSIDNNNLIGTLANINQNPISSFANNNLQDFLGNRLTESPQNQGDLYTADSKEALVGGAPLIINNGITDYQLQINDIEGYKDTIFISTSYINNDGNGIGGIYYSQALFNEYGMIKAWSMWQRKNIYGNCQTQAFVPTIGSNIAIYSKINNQIFGSQFSNSGPFLSSSTKNYGLLSCASSGIEKIIDIPYTHPGIGRNSNPILNLKPSYLIAVGYNTVILQQTAKNNALRPIINGNTINCMNGNTTNIIDKNIETNIITFQGGALEEANALFTAALGYSEIDAWLIVAGSNGIYILANSDGTGCGPTLLQDNFTGIKPTLSWQQLGNFKTIKKIVSNKDFLYVVSNDGVYRIPLNSSNISLKNNCNYTVLLKNNDLPGATPFSSFSDGIFSNNVCILATSVGLFTNAVNSSIKVGSTIALKKIPLPESFGVMPLALYPITLDGNIDSWGNGNNTDITGNIYIMATSLSQHYSKIYRLICYGNNSTNKNTIFLLSNYFIKDFPTYYYNPNIELLSIATDGGSIFAHGIYGNSIVYRSFIGILNPFIRHGNMALKNEYNFFELASKTNSYFGYPAYISGIGIWLFSGQNGIQGLC
jgi:hypothetical protein